MCQSCSTGGRVAILRAEFESSLRRDPRRPTWIHRPVVIAVGGNVITRAGQRGTVEEHPGNLAVMGRQLAQLAEVGWPVVVTHGNGPQVGNIKLQQEAGEPQAAAMPLDVCGAMSQGQIVYLLQMALSREFARKGIHCPVAAVVTRCVVDPNDRAFNHPTKPIGPFYDRQTAERLRARKGWSIVSDSGRGFRRVVPSPAPRQFVEIETIHLLVRSGALVIACGGGGLPVQPAEGGGYKGSRPSPTRIWSSHCWRWSWRQSRWRC